MHVVTRQVQRYQALEYDAPSRKRAGQKDQQTRGCASIRYHIQHGTEFGALFESAGGDAIEGVQKAGYAVEESASTRMEGHVVEGYEGKHDAEVA
jgi:hypothetical protein